MPASEGCVLILGRRSRISPLLVVVVLAVVVSRGADTVVGARVMARGWREGRRGVRMLKDLQRVSIGHACGGRFYCGSN